MTAAEAIRRAAEAGLTLHPDVAGLRVVGPKAARAELVPVLRPLTGQILRLIGPADRAPEEPTCTECRQPARVLLVQTDGSQTCADCLTGRTVMRKRGVPV